MDCPHKCGRIYADSGCPATLNNTFHGSYKQKVLLKFNVEFAALASPTTQIIGINEDSLTFKVVSSIKPTPGVASVKILVKYQDFNRQQRRVPSRCSGRSLDKWIVWNFADSSVWEGFLRKIILQIEVKKMQIREEFSLTVEFMD